jgi:3-deoxy-7-phosphoheptulonate synthase
MLIVMRLDASREEIERVKAKVKSLGYLPHEIPGVQRVAIGITGNPGKVDPEHFLNMTGVVDAIPVSKPYKLVSRDVKARKHGCPLSRWFPEIRGNRRGRAGNSRWALFS